MSATLGFEETYRCYSMAFVDRQDLEHGDKILLPSTALAKLSSMHVQYPMMFRLAPVKNDVRTHVGVYEFSATEGQVIVPGWIMRSLGINEGAIVSIRNVSLPKGSFVKLQPLTTDFIHLSDPRAILERHLKKYSCLTKGGTLTFHYEGLKKDFTLNVLELKPADAVSIIETDLVVDFAAPVDYVEPARPAAIHAPGSATSAADGSSALKFGSGAASASSAAGAGGVGSSSSAGGGTPSGFGASAGSNAAAGGQALGGASGSPMDSAARRSLAAEAAARRFGGGSPGAGDGGGTPSKFAPKVVPFTGQGYTIRDTAGGAGGSTTPGGAGGSPMTGGGTVLTRPGSAAGAKPRTLNRFEEARKAKAFQGQGKTILD